MEWILCCLLAFGLQASQPAQSDTSAERLRYAAQRLHAADTPDRLSEIYAALFRNATDNELREYQLSPDPAFALASAWEAVRRTVPKGEHNAISPAEGALSSFVTIAQERTGVALPALWRAAILSAGSYGRDSIWFPVFKLLHPELVRRSAQAHPQTRYTPQTRPSVRREGDRVTVTAGGKTWSLQSREGVGLRDHAVVACTDAKAFLAVYPSACDHYSVYALENDGRDPVWVARVWAEDGVSAYTGEPTHDVALLVHGNDLLVFGVADHAAYVEVFDVRTGASLWRFGTGYFRLPPYNSE